MGRSFSDSGLRGSGMWSSRRSRSEARRRVERSVNAGGRRGMSGDDPAPERIVNNYRQDGFCNAHGRSGRVLGPWLDRASPFR